jgi:streptogrisin C
MVTGDDLVKVLSGPMTAGPVNTNSCMPKLCAPPMRGGMRLDFNRNTAAPVYPSSDNLNAWWGECTNGFNMTDTRGWSYILTAGHCAVGPNKSGDTRSYSSYDTGRIPVGYELPDFENANVNGSEAYPWDFALQPYTSGSQASYWLSGGARNLVDSYCFTYEGTQSCTEGNFGITGYYYYYSQIHTGWVVCGTGSSDANSAGGYHSNIGYSAGTRCGEVTVLNNGIRTNLCMRPGDSGGPLFSEIDNKAYGILSNGTTASGPCPSAPAGTEYSQYTPVQNVIIMAASQTGYGFNVRTSP